MGDNFNDYVNNKNITTTDSAVFPQIFNLQQCCETGFAQMSDLKSSYTIERLNKSVVL